jgi:hypothetical protein
MLFIGDVAHRLIMVRSSVTMMWRERNDTVNSSSRSSVDNVMLVCRKRG